MKQKLIHFSSFLPALLLFVLICTPYCAEAGLLDDVKSWAVDKVTGAVTSALGIDTDINCVPPREHQICLFCDMFKIIFNAGSHVAEAAYGVFHTDLGQLVVIFFAVSVALIILKNVASFGSKDPGTLMNDIMTKLFVCAMIYYIITRDYYNILNMTIVPILKDGLAFVGLVNGGDHASCSYAAEIHGFADSAGAGGAIKGGLPKSIGDMIVCAIYNIEGKINNLFEYGKWAFCRGFGPDRIFHILPHPIYIIDGILLYLGGIFFMVAYPWILGDAVIQLGISFAILPFAVAGYAFNGTKNYLSKTFSWILNSLFVFIFMGILIECLLDYINNILVQATTYISDPKELFTNPNTGLAFFGPNMLMIIFVLVLAWTYMPEIKDLAGEFAKGSQLSAASAVGTVLTDKMEENADKMASHVADTAGSAAVATVRSTKRRTNSLMRHAAMGITRFGHTNGFGGRTFNFAGPKWLTRGLSFSVEKSANGDSILRREFTSVTGRNHVMLSDKYSTLKQEYTASGKLIKSDVKFKHGFIEEHLLDKDGNMNIGALKTLLDSPIGQNPDYRQALIEQVAVKVLKTKGKDVGKYFTSRNVTFDPNDPSKISIVQIDHAGKITKFGMDINMLTGQTAIGYAQNITETSPMANISRQLNMSAQDAFLNKMGHNTAAGGKAFDSWMGLMHYESQTDSAGDIYYTRTRRKYLFFGSKITKVYDKNGVTVDKVKSAKAQQKLQKKIDKIDKKLQKGTPNANGGMTRKTLFYTYESHVDETGNMVYTKKLRSGWNAKNYYRAARHPLSNTWTTGDITSYSVSGTTKTDSRTGNILDKDLMQSVTITSSNGSQTVVDKTTGQKTSSDKINSEYELYFSNGAVELRTTGLMSQQGKVFNEKTKYSYSAAVQAGHDSILSNYDGNQVVEADGSLAKDLEQYINGDPSRPNPLYLLHGMDNIAGLTSLGGMPMQDFVVNEILAKGRQRRTNKFKTQLGSAFFPIGNNNDDDSNDDNNTNSNDNGTEDDNSSFLDIFLNPDSSTTDNTQTTIWDVFGGGNGENEEEEEDEEEDEEDDDTSS